MLSGVGFKNSPWFLVIQERGCTVGCVLEGNSVLLLYGGMSLVWRMEEKGGWG
ncbi:hypothetical protein [Bartonella sp. TT121SHDZB]|uniref:hypothetical protein n=1 Tax=Bartonella sp. TT121SHDZB TaxID=3243580 RepID=UPI0035CF21E1